MTHKYDLTILNCVETIFNLFETELDILKSSSYEPKKQLREYVKGELFPTKKVEITSFSYFEKLYDYIKIKAFPTQFQNIQLTDELYEEIKKLMLQMGFNPEKIKPIDFINKGQVIIFILFFIAVKKQNSIKSFDENTKKNILELFEKSKQYKDISFDENKKTYFTFLIILFFDYGVVDIEDILNHHINKTFFRKDFVKSLKNHLKIIPEPLKDDLILGEINEWINKHSHLENIIINIDDMVIEDDEIEDDDLELNNYTPEKKAIVQTGLQSLFIVEDWEKYIDALTVCEPPILKKEKEIYTFIGNKKTQRGVVASWFKYLRTKGIINQSINRYLIAEILSSEIKNYQISGSSFDNTSNLYNKQFSRQLEKFIY